MPQAARIPAGYSIVIELQNDINTQVVTGATWTVLDSSGNSVGTPATYYLSTTEGGGVPPGDLSKIASFQVTFGGAGGGDYATFTSGAGVIIYEAEQAMIVQASYPSCIGYQAGTAEGSNIGYGAMCPGPSTLLSQAFSAAPAAGQARIANPNARSLRPPHSWQDTKHPHPPRPPRGASSPPKKRSINVNELMT
jgi:hypothetical protein